MSFSGSFVMVFIKTYKFKCETVLHNCEKLKKGKGKGRGNFDIGTASTQIGKINVESVYLAIRNLTLYRQEKRGVTLDEIWHELDRQRKLEVSRAKKELEEWGKRSWNKGDLARREELQKRLRKETMTRRTIQSCIKKDPRIRKDRWLFYIDYQTMFEKRYLRPSEFGRRLYRRYLDETVGQLTTLDPPESPEKTLKKLITKLGVFLIFSFIEAARPFKDESMSIRDRGELVSYWIHNCIPIFEIYSNFRSSFDQREAPEKAKFDQTISYSELDENSVEKVLGILKRLHPGLVKALVKVSKEEVDVVHWDGRKHYVRAKEYYSNWTEV